MTRPDFDQLLETAWTFEGPCWCRNCAPSLRRAVHITEENAEWSLRQAVSRLGIRISERTPKEDDPRGYDYVRTDGVAWMEGPERLMWINEIADARLRTAAHELAHHEHGHTRLAVDGHWKSAVFRQGEAEAESTAMLVWASLGATEDELNLCRVYIRKHWPAPLPPESRARVKSAAHRILAAGLRADVAVAA